MEAVWKNHHAEFPRPILMNDKEGSAFLCDISVK
jgi:hypothetical protein